MKKEENYTIDYIIKNNIHKTAFGFIYMTINLINNKKYIGKRQFYNKWQDYLGSGVLLRKALSKYGKESFNRIIISYANTKDELNQQEILYIEKYDAVNSLSFYNIASGGQGGFAQFAGKSEKEIELWKKE